MHTLMIVDDEPNVLYTFEKIICQRRQDVQVTTAENGTAAIEAFERCVPDAVILDVCLPDMSGLDVFKRFHRLAPNVPIIVVTGHASTDLAIEATKQGAFDFLLKPIDVGQLREVVDRCLDHSLQVDSSEAINLASIQRPVDGIVGQSPPMQSVYKFIGRVAPENVTVLILGESGTGKELVATEVYRHSERRKQPFLVINCAALTETLLESELFGHEKGAFTGATSRHRGKFEQAHRGTLFLDELGDMSIGTQAKILRVLQDGKFERVGGDETITTDVRLVCATNHDLERRIEQGLFRRDLLYRLNGFSVRIPPLRDRLEDLPALIEHFLNLSNQKFERRVLKVSPSAYDQLSSYAWPGNIRELQSVIQFAVLHTLNEVLTVDALPDLLSSDALDQLASHETSEARGQIEMGTRVGTYAHRVIPEGEPAPCLPDVSCRVRHLLEMDEPELFRSIITDAEQVVIREVLSYFDGNQVQASRVLGISRTTLRGKLDLHREERRGSSHE